MGKKWLNMFVINRGKRLEWAIKIYTLWILIRSTRLGVKAAPTSEVKRNLCFSEREIIPVNLKVAWIIIWYKSQATAFPSLSSTSELQIWLLTKFFQINCEKDDCKSLQVIQWMTLSRTGVSLLDQYISCLLYMVDSWIVEIFICSLGLVNQTKVAKLRICSIKIFMFFCFISEGVNSLVQSLFESRQSNV